jgi:hypothetical protein
VVPRATPRGDTELIVGGVVRFPDGESFSAAKQETAASAVHSNAYLMTYLEALRVSIVS